MNLAHSTFDYRVDGAGRVGDEMDPWALGRCCGRALAKPCEIHDLVLVPASDRRRGSESGLEMDDEASANPPSRMPRPLVMDRYPQCWGGFGFAA